MLGAAPYWSEIETYVASRTAATFTHGMCPSCAARLDRTFDEDARDDAKPGPNAEGS